MSSNHPRRTVLIVLGCTTLLAGCGVLGPRPHRAELEALRASRARWHRHEIKSYRYTLELRAMIIDGRPISVEVRDGVPVAVRYLEGGASVAGTPEGSFVARFDTVDEMFRVIEEELERGPHRISATYDPSLGHPASADFDPRATVIDDEFGFRVSGFEGLR